MLFARMRLWRRCLWKEALLLIFYSKRDHKTQLVGILVNITYEVGQKYSFQLTGIHEHKNNRKMGMGFEQYRLGLWIRTSIWKIICLGNGIRTPFRSLYQAKVRYIRAFHIVHTSYIFIKWFLLWNKKILSSEYVSVHLTRYIFQPHLLYVPMLLVLNSHNAQLLEHVDFIVWKLENPGKCLKP